MIAVVATRFDEAKIFVPDIFTDERGVLEETFSAKNYRELGLTDVFVQDTVTWSHKHVLRGPHYDFDMAKFVQVLRGSVFDVIVDMRVGSKTFKQWQGFELSSDNRRQLYIPRGFAHGFVTLSDDVIFHYKLTAHHDPANELRIHWRDPLIGIVWPVTEGVIVSAKDAAP